MNFDLVTHCARCGCRLRRGQPVYRGLVLIRGVGAVGYLACEPCREILIADPAAVDRLLDAAQRSDAALEVAPIGGRA